LLLLLSVLIIIILLGELALRVIIYDETSGHGASPGSLKFNQKHVELNKEGFRDVDYSFSKPNNTMRIAVVGDSFTFGMGVNNVNDTYPKVLERDLASLNLTRNFEVLNFGIPGYDTKDHIKTIEDHVLKYNPDVIVIGYVLNDLPNPENIDVKYQKIELPFIGFWLRSSSYLYYFIESRLNELLRGNSPDYNYESIMSKLYNSSLNKNESDRIYKQIADVANQNNITVLVVTFPIIYKLNNYPFKEAHKHVDELAYKNHFLHIDLLKDYQRYRVEDLVVNQYDAHPNELGQKIAADVISDYLMRKGVLLQSI
jgi:lysophospholipase L1-like esterase